MNHVELIKFQRLNRIRTGQCEPRWHRADEVTAWEQGVHARQSLFAGVLALFLSIWGVGQAINSKSPPAGQSGAATIAAQVAP